MKTNHRHYFRALLIIIFCTGLFLPTITNAATTPVTSITKKYSYWKKNTINTRNGRFNVQIIRIGLDNPNLKVKTITGNSTDCKNNCAVYPLKTYVDKFKGFAAINGTYFCPKDYASCAKQTGSYYWMVYNSITRTFTNSYQNQFNKGALIAFDTENHWHFWRETKYWPGLDAFEDQYQTKLTALISSGPALIVDKRLVVRTSDLDAKQRNVKSNRGGIALKGNNVYLVIASGATVLDLGAIMQAYGMTFAVNLDGGGSSALYYYGQYRVGPGRNMPNAIVFTER